MVTIGITTYNRKKILEMMASSLYGSDLSVAHNIRIYDDCSTEYGVEELRRIFPTAASIEINKENIRADQNIFQMHKDFLKTSDTFLFNADSDLIFSKNWLNTALELVKKTSGILTLFNANSHGPCRPVDNDLCLKKTIGSAGTLLHRDRIEELLDYIDSTKNVKAFDWQFSGYFNKMEIPIYCVNSSLVQHIGYIGQNTHFYFDIGRNFNIESLEQGQIMNDMIESFIDNIREIETARMDNFSYHLRRIVSIFLKKILPEKMYKSLKRRLIKK